MQERLVPRLRTKRLLAALLATLAACRAEPPAPESETDEVAIAIPDPPALLEAPHALAQVPAFAEGPTWHPDGYLVFTIGAHNRILIHRPGNTEFEVIGRAAHRPNGTALDHQNQLVVCEGHQVDIADEGRAVVRWDLVTHERTIIVDRFEGQRFHGPNDLVIDRRGRIYFSDPRYERDASDTTLAGAVYRVDPDGSNLIRVLGPDQVRQPNGVALDPSERILYITDTTLDAGPSRLYAFALDQHGLPTGARTTLYDFGVGRGGDGMCVDTLGNLFVTAGSHRPPAAPAEVPAGLHVFDPSGKLLTSVAIDDRMPTNCTHGGADGRTIFVTGTRWLWTVQTTIAGANHGSHRE